MIQTGPTTSLIPKSSEQTELTLDNSIINFNNEITVDGEKRIRFFERRHPFNKELIEYAYITKEDKNIIHFVNNDFTYYPKNKINEFIINLYARKNKEVIKKHKTSNLHFIVKISGINIPVIFYMLLTKTWDQTFKFLNIQYNEDTKKTGDYHIVFNNTIVNMNPTTLRDKYIVNGLLTKKAYFKGIDFKKDDTTLLDIMLTNEIGAYKLDSLRRSHYKIIDHTSQEILKEDGYPIDIFELYAKTMPDLILSREQKANLDISNFRLRMSEVVSHFMYNQIQQSVSFFKKKAKSNSNSKIEIQPNFIINNLQSAGIMQYTKSVNPLEELLISTKVTKTGMGNTTKQQVTLERRDLNPSYFGTISPTTTNEYSGIGSNQTLSIGSKIKDAYGTIDTDKNTTGTKTLNKKLNETNSFDNISLSEALNPFMEYNDTTRAVMGNQQTSQFVELRNPDEPLVQTGIEAIIPHIVSSRFAKKAKDAGKIIKIDDRYITIKYNDPKLGIDQIDIKMVKTRTKRGIYLPSEYKILATVGQSVTKGQILASTSSLASGKMAMGKNLVVAEIPYFGMNYEDGWVVTDSVKEKFNTDILTKVNIRIPTGAKIQNFNLGSFTNFSSGTNTTKTGDVLIEFQKENFQADLYASDLEDDDDIMTGLIQKDKTIKYLSPGGIIKDIVVKINNKEGIPKEVIKLHQVLTEPLEKRLKDCASKSDDPAKQTECLGHIENLEMLSIGEHKINNVEFDGVLIEVYILTDNPVRNGSKFVLSNSGGKGTIQYIIPTGMEPVTTETNLKIEFIGTPLSIIGRKSPNIIYNLYLGKIMYFVNKKAIELAKDSKFAQIKKLVIDIYECIDKTEDRSIISQIEDLFKKEARTVLKQIINSDPLNRPFFPAIVPPFKNHLVIKDLENAAAIIGIPLNEKVYMKEHDIVSEQEVVVGILPIYMLEHFPKGMSSVRGSINTKDQFLTGQGISGSQEGKGAIKVGLYDMYGLLSKNKGDGKQLSHLFKELHSIKSDSVYSKRKYENSLMYKNELPSIDIMEETSKKDTKTKNWIEAMFIGCGLQPEF